MFLNLSCLSVDLIFNGYNFVISYIDKNDLYNMFVEFIGCLEKTYVRREQKALLIS